MSHSDYGYLIIIVDLVCTYLVSNAKSSKFARVVAIIGLALLSFFSFRILYELDPLYWKR